MHSRIALARLPGTPSSRRRLALLDRPVSLPEPGGVIVRPRTAGVCGTDLQILRGLRDDPAVVIGHEADGVVEAVGAGVSDLAVGNDVLFNPTCPVDQDLILGHSMDGVWQSSVNLPAAAVAGGLVRRHRVPPAPLAALVEPLAAVLYALELVVVAIGQPRSIAVIGGGSVGLLTAAAAPLALSAAPERVAVVHPDRHRLAWAEARGLLAHDNTATALGTSDIASFDAVIVAVPRPFGPSAVEQAVMATRDGGVIDLFGGLGSNETSPMMPGVDLSGSRRANVGGNPWPPRISAVRDRLGRPLNLTGHRGVGWAHLARAVDLLERHPERLAPVISHRVGLAEALPVLEDYRTGGRRLHDGEPWVKLALDIEMPNRPMEPWHYAHARA